MTKSPCLGFGEDEELKEVRNKLPEPSRYDGYIIITVLPYKHGLNFEKIYIPEECLKEAPRVTFMKTLVKLKDLSFYAWQSEKDGKIYL